MERNPGDSDILEGVPGVRRAAQKRSRKKRDDLLSAGIALLRDTDFEQLSIKHITDAAGCSVGSFYERFDDKDSFLLALQRTVFHRQVDEARKKLSVDKWSGVPTDEVIAAAVRILVGNFRSDAEGLLRASMVRSIAKPEVWEPSRRASEDLVALLKHLLAGRLLGDDTEMRIEIAVQVLNGILLNMILRDPGPLRLQDERTDEALTQLICKSVEPYANSASL